MKRFFCIISVVAMCLSLLAEENTMQNTVKWNLDDQGILTIKGKCPISDYPGADAPWAYFKEKISKVIIEDGVTGIGSAAFSGCHNLSDISIPNSISYIGERAFYNCSNLEKVIVPQNVIKIGKEAFYKCINLKHVVLPINLKEIPDGLFRKCSNLKKFSIPSSVISIGDYAFEGCGKIDFFSIPDKVTSIGEGAFKGCNSLIEVTIPEGVSIIGKETFSKCEFLEKVTISSSVKQIGRNAFHPCPRLVDVYINASSVPQVEGNPFGNNSKKIYLWVPSHRKRNYMHDKYWGQFMMRVENEDEPLAAQEEKLEENSTILSTASYTTPFKKVEQGESYVVSSSSNLNVRSAADAKASVIGSVHAGDTVQVTNTVGNWGQITYKSKTGYVSMSYLKKAVMQPRVAFPDVTSTLSTANTPSKQSTISTLSEYSYNTTANTQTNNQTSTPAKTQTKTQEITPTATATTTLTTSTISANTAPAANDAATQPQGVSLGMFLDLSGDVGKNKTVDATGGGIGADFIIGFHTPERYNFLGAGVGFQALFSNPSKNLKTTSLILPLYANDKFYFTNTGNDLYLDLSLGGFIALMAKVNDEKQKVKGGGFYFRSGLGIDIKGVNLSVGYELLFQEKIDYAMHMCYFKIGLGSDR